MRSVLVEDFVERGNKGLSCFTKDNNVNVMTLLEIALQLLLEDEMELLDDLCKAQL